ncbi:MAG: Rrf2 family transcriptional regulator [Clostridia bacterium]|nr:Rrf2 family transcriptional regulator [Clostridia bacterium]
MRSNAQFTMAVHALLMIGVFPDTKIISKTVAESAGSNPVLVCNLFAKLIRAGIIETRPGRGKTKLAKDAKQITLRDIYEAVEPFDLASSFPYHKNMSGKCAVVTRVEGLLNPHLEETMQALRQRLARVTVADLIHDLHKDIQNTMKTHDGGERQ